MKPTLNDLDKLKIGQYSKKPYKMKLPRINYKPYHETLMTLGNGAISLASGTGGAFSIDYYYDNTGDFKNKFYLYLGAFALYLSFLTTLHAKDRIAKYHSNFLEDLKQNTELFLYRMGNAIRIP